MLRLIVYASITSMCIADSLTKAEATLPVLVALRAESVVGNGLVKTGDVADLIGGDLVMRERIAILDIAEREKAQTGTITKSQIALRLRLAGISKSDFQVTGPARAVIRWEGAAGDDPVMTSQPSADRPIVAIAKVALSELWLVPPEDVDVRLARPISLSVRKLMESDSSITLKPFLPQSAAPGPIRLSFGAYRDANLVQRSAAMIEARLQRQVAVATRDIGMRHVLSKDDVRFERRPTEGRVASQATTEVLGKVATHAIRKGAVLMTSDVREVVVAETPRTAVIKRGDPVRLIARGNGLTVSVRSCEAIENGREGETIRVRNLNSKKIVAGRVVGAGEVEIAL